MEILRKWKLDKQRWKMGMKTGMERRNNMWKKGEMSLKVERYKNCENENENGKCLGR